MNTLVTGGAGFLGSHLCDRLLGHGHTVTCLDNFLTGDMANISHLQSHPRFRVLRQDVTEPIRDGFDWIFNLACPASPVHYQADPIRTVKTSVLGALQVLEVARRCGARIFQASTSEIYGDPECHPQTEAYWGHVNSIGPRACYDEGKRCAETLFAEYHRCQGVDIRMVRIFNTYGPRMAIDDGRVVSNFVVGAIRGRPLPIYGDGSQTRSFCYVEDLIDGFMRLMSYEGPECWTPFNLGNPGEFTILELAQLVQQLIGYALDLNCHPLPQDDPKKRRPDIARARRLLNWEPRIGLERGISLTIDYFQRRMGGAAGPGILRRAA